MFTRISTTVLALSFIAALGLGTTAVFGQAQKGARKAAPPAAAAKPKPALAAPASSTIQAKKVERVDVVNPQTVQEFEKKDRVAVIAAVGRYTDDKLPPLQFPMADAVELAAEFKRQGYTVYDLLNNRATADNIRERLEAIVAQIQPATFVFSFSGHGFQSADGKNFLATYGTTVDSLEQQGLSLNEVEALMKKSGARRSVLLVDACRNSPGEKAARGPRTFKDFSEAEGVRILLSTRPGGFSYEDSALEHGIFTHFMLEALRGKAAGPDGKITFDDMAGYVETNVFKYSSEKGFIQKPFRSGEASGDFLIATGKPLKEDEVVRAKEESGSKNITNDSLVLQKQGSPESFLMVRRGGSLYLYQMPSMLAFASLTEKPVNGLAADQKRFEGKAGTGNQTMQAVVRFDHDLPVELSGRLGVPCQGNCNGQDVPLPGETPATKNVKKTQENVGNSVKSIAGRFGLGGRRTGQVVDSVGDASRAVPAGSGMNWTVFNLLPDQKPKK